MRPPPNQEATMLDWLELLRKQYNYHLGERLDWERLNKCPVDRCSIISCPIAPPKDRPSYYSQQNDLLNTKKLFPEYKAIHSQVLQDCVKRIDRTWQRFTQGDSNGKRSGRPRFKSKGRYHSFTYTQMKPGCLDGKLLTLPKLGVIKLILHRPIPNGFVIKTATVTHRADGWYVSLSLLCDDVPLLAPDPNPENTIGIDLGLKAFLVTSEGEEVAIPQHYRKAEKKLRRIQRQLSKKKKGSNNRNKALRRVAKLQQRTANQRKDFHHKTASNLVVKHQVIAHEDLNIKGLAKSRLAKSVNDAGWGQFLSILAVKAANAGRMTIAVNPNGTSQECSSCGTHVPKTLADRWHNCPSCALSLDRDHNAALNIKQKAVGHPVSARGGFQDAGPMNLEARSIPLCG